MAQAKLSGDAARRRMASVEAQLGKADRDRLTALLALIGPDGRITAVGAALNTQKMLNAPSISKNKTDIQVPVISSQRGVCHSPAASATSTQTPITIKPCPPENKTPAQRASRGRLA